MVEQQALPSAEQNDIHSWGSGRR